MLIRVRLHIGLTLKEEERDLIPSARPPRVVSLEFLEHL